MDSDYLFVDAKREIPKITNKFSRALRITRHNPHCGRLSLFVCLHKLL